MKVIILEFAPCADWLYHFRRDEEEGYIAGDERTVTIRSGAKLRPHTASIYAGGKATNVARVMDRLLNKDEAIEIELVVFRPDSPEGRYIHELQIGALQNVRVRPVIIKGLARLCVDLLDPATPAEHRAEFNISPRALWEEGSLEKALEFVCEMSADLLLMAGNPPLLAETNEMAVNLYSQIIERVRPCVKTISLDTEKRALASCLQAQTQADVIKINSFERDTIDAKLWEKYGGTLVVTDAKGCTVTEKNQSVKRLRGAKIATLYSTIGAGDAVHAGFTLARSVWGFDVAKAARYGQAAAAATVSASAGTRAITKQIVDEFFAKLENEDEGEETDEAIM
jgi:fructose-1-phosphate kinase PfkB-like protein